MDLPLHLQMEIDLSAQAHAREIAEGFAKLRGELAPEPAKTVYNPAANAWGNSFLAQQSGLPDHFLSLMGAMGYQMVSPKDMQNALQKAYPNGTYSGLYGWGPATNYLAPY